MKYCKKRRWQVERFMPIRNEKINGRMAKLQCREDPGIATAQRLEASGPCRQDRRLAGHGMELGQQ
jgi:hypothetical protein